MIAKDTKLGWQCVVKGMSRISVCREECLRDSQREKNDKVGEGVGQVSNEEQNHEQQTDQTELFCLLEKPNSSRF